MARELEAERRQFDVQRTDQVRARQFDNLSAVLAHLQWNVAPRSVCRLLSSLTRNKQARKTMELQHTLSSAMQSAKTLSPPLPPAHSQGVTSPPPPSRATADAARAVMTLQVFRGHERTWVGEVLIGRETTVGELRRVVGTRYSAPPYHLYKRDVPIPIGQDHHLAFDYFASEDDFLCVE